MGCRTYREFLSVHGIQLDKDEPPVSAHSLPSTPTKTGITPNIAELKVTYQHRHFHNHQICVKDEGPQITPSKSTQHMTDTVHSILSQVKTQSEYQPVQNLGPSLPSQSASGLSQKTRPHRVQRGYKIIKLENHELEVCESDLPPPPWIAFSGGASETEKLFQAWYTDPDSLLKIQGVVIPLQFWAQLYRGTRWYTERKETWNRWKVRLRFIRAM